MFVLRLVATVFRIARRLLILLVVLALIALNVATLTVSAVSALASSALSLIGVTSIPLSLSNDLARQSAELRAAREGQTVLYKGSRRAVKDVAREVSERVSKRTASIAGTNLASMVGEGIPFWGIAVIVAATTVEIKGACDTMQEMYELRVALDPEVKIPDNRDEVCGLQIPTADDLRKSIKSNVSAAVQAAYDALPDVDLPSPPDPSAVRGWIGSWFD